VRKTLICIIALIFLTACSKPATDARDAARNDPSAQSASVILSVDEDGNVSEITPPPKPADLTSLEFARAMGYGINLGNTMEACDSKNRIPNREPSVYETMWGQPVTTQAMITGMKNAGFKTLRIPVAWTNAMDFENGDYTIDPAYLDRVAEIVDYALNEDMYVIINDHWDHGWWSMFGHPDAAVIEMASEMYGSMWTQIATRFAKYDQRLIFEAGNEELGNRFNDKTPFSPDGGKLTEDQCYAFLRRVTFHFVFTVRGVPGNENRYLLIPGYNTDIVKTCDERYQMPIDAADDKLLISVHYYTPWAYCGDNAGTSNWGTLSDVEEQNALLEMMTKFTEQGYGVVLGEWGVLDNEGEDRLTFYTNFLDNCDKYGYVPLLWDTGGMYDRTSCTMRADDIAKLFSERSGSARADLSLDEIIQKADDNIAWTKRKAANRPEVVIEANEAFAWLMFSSGDWSTQYSVGDIYKPESITNGVVATDVEVTGPGAYTVALDFTGTDAGFADGFVFSAVGIINGEILFPGYIIDIKEVLINGEPAEFSGTPYTASDNGITTRVNLYNEWVSQIPDDARARGEGDLVLTPVPLEGYTSEKIEHITVTFEYDIVEFVSE